MSALTDLHNARLPPMMKLLGVELVSVEKTRVVGRMLAREDMGNGYMVLHGGAFMAFADHIGATGAVVNLPEGMRTATIESKTNFFLPARIGAILTAESVPLHIGSKTMVWQTRITNPEGRMLAMITQTQIVMPLDRTQEKQRGQG